MEDLNQHQLILLVLLVSFVTSIGTGIITVSLLQEAPPVITSTVNRVVEKTIETVVPNPETTGGETETIREVTVVVNQEELVTESIATISESIVRIYETNGVGENFYGVGFIVGNNIVSAQHGADTGNVDYRAVFNDGRETLVTRRENNAQEGIAIFRITDGTAGQSATFGDVNGLKLGQSLIAIGGVESNEVSIGTLSSIIKDETSGGARELKVIFENEESVLGAPVINLKGQIIGVRVQRTMSDGSATTYIMPVRSAQELVAQAI